MYIYIYIVSICIYIYCMYTCIYIYIYQSVFFFCTPLTRHDVLFPPTPRARRRAARRSAERRKSSCDQIPMSWPAGPAGRTGFCLPSEAIQPTGAHTTHCLAFVYLRIVIIHFYHFTCFLIEGKGRKGIRKPSQVTRNSNPGDSPGTGDSLAGGCLGSIDPGECFQHRWPF